MLEDVYRFPFEEAEEEHVAKVHTKEYIDALKEVHAVFGISLIQACANFDENAVDAPQFAHFDEETYYNKHTFSNALLAASAPIEALN